MEEIEESRLGGVRWEEKERGGCYCGEKEPESGIRRNAEVF